MAPLMSRLSLLFFWSSLLFSAVNAGKTLRGVGFKPTDAPVEASKTIVDIASGSEDFSILVDLVVKAGLAETLSGEGPFTVFAPTNAAFLSVVESVDDLTEIDPAIIATVLTYHVVPGTYLSSDITDGLLLTTVQGETIEFGVSDSAITVNEEVIGPADIAASNGVIHVIDGVMFPKVLLTPTDPSVEPEAPAPVEPAPAPVEPAPAPVTPVNNPAGTPASEATDPSAGTIVELASGAAPEFSTLVELVVLAGLAETLSGPGPFTVFAPTDAAFAGVIQDQDNLDLAAVAEILTYHVVPGTYLSSDITDGLLLTTVQGETIEFAVSESGITVNEEKIGPANVKASNGVIHVIDGVLIPKAVLTPAEEVEEPAAEPAPAPAEDIATIVEIAVGAAPELSTLVDLVVLANLVDVLSGPDPFTVFAPSNSAFAEVIVDIDALEQLDPDIITEILTYHVVPGTIAAADITDGLLLTTVQGETIEFRVSDGVATVNDEGILFTDIPASNGVVHIISGVMFPKSVLVEVAEEEATADEPEPTIVDLAVSDADLSILVGLVSGADLVPTLSGEGPFTVFAPVNAAFFELLSTLGVDATQLDTLDPSVLAGVLTYHVVSGTILASDITDGLTLPTVQGGSITFAVTDAGVTVNGEQIIAADLAGSNGVVHKIDGVLIPKGLMR